MNFNNFTFCYIATFKNVALTTGFGNIFKLAPNLHHFHDLSPCPISTQCQFMRIFQTFFQCFYVTNVWRCVCYVDASTSNRSQHVTPKGAGVHEMSVCVASGASRFGTDFGASFRCRKYAMFSNTFGTPVRQNTLCVTFGARAVAPFRPSSWARLGPVGPPTPAKKSGTPPPPPDSRRQHRQRVRQTTPTRPPHEHLQTS